jgi:hypothetical protein
MELVAGFLLFAPSALFLLCFDNHPMFVLTTRVYFLPPGGLGFGCLTPGLFFGLGWLGNLELQALADFRAFGDSFAEPFIGCLQRGKLAFETRLGLVTSYDFAPKLADRRMRIFQLRCRLRPILSA